MPSGVPRRDHPWRVDDAPLDRLAELDRHVAAEVAHRGEAGPHGDGPEAHRVDGTVGLGARDRVGEGGRADLSGQVRVRVDESGQQRDIAQVHVVHHVGYGIGVHRRDDPVLDHDDRVRVHHAGLDIEEARGAQDRRAVVHAGVGVVALLSGEGGGGKRRGQRREGECGREEHCGQLACRAGHGHFGFGLGHAMDSAIDPARQRGASAGSVAAGQGVREQVTSPRSRRE